MLREDTFTHRDGSFRQTDRDERGRAEEQHSVS